MLQTLNVAPVAPASSQPTKKASASKGPASDAPEGSSADGFSFHRVLQGMHAPLTSEFNHPPVRDSLHPEKSAVPSAKAEIFEEMSEERIPKDAPAMAMHAVATPGETDPVAVQGPQPSAPDKTGSLAAQLLAVSTVAPDNTSIDKHAGNSRRVEGKALGGSGVNEKAKASARGHVLRPHVATAVPVVVNASPLAVQIQMQVTAATPAFTTPVHLPEGMQGRASAPSVAAIVGRAEKQKQGAPSALQSSMTAPESSTEVATDDAMTAEQIVSPAGGQYHAPAVGDGKAVVSIGAVHPDAGAAPGPGLHAMASPLQGATNAVTFRSSFLQETSRTVDGKLAVEDLLPASPLESPVVPSGAVVRHLQVDLKDLGMGPISVRAEMRDGALHASVSGVQGDSLLTATALHQFLEQNQVAVHGLHVDAAPIVRQPVSAATANVAAFVDSSGSGDKQRREQAREQGDHPQWVTREDDTGSVAKMRSEAPSLSTMPGAMRLPAASKRLSIHI